MSNIYILYHGNCQDGLGAKRAAYYKFKNDATYIPVFYHKPMPEIPDGAEVYILDFSYPREELLRLRVRSQTLTVIDHHKTAAEDLKGLDFAFFNMEKSGAVMAWEYFNPEVPVPKLLLRIQDRDIWRWQYKDTKDVLSMVTLAGEDFDLWDDLETNYENTVKNGKAVSTYQDHCVRLGSEPDKCRIVTYKGHKTALVCCTHMVSEICNALCLAPELGVAFTIGFFITPEGTAALSFRSNGNLDVSVLAKELGGGGHKSAAGASMKLQDFINIFYTGENANV